MRTNIYFLYMVDKAKGYPFFLVFDTELKLEEEDLYFHTIAEDRQANLVNVKRIL